MRRTLSLGLAAISLAALVAPSGQAQILTPGSAIIAIDRDPPSSASSYPAAENPPKAFDAMLGTKYLNFGGNVPRNIGVIITPAGGASTVQSLQFTTANDAPARDPLTWELAGTNDAILSADNSDGLGGEAWTTIATGMANLPDTRGTAGPVYAFPANATAYASYRILIPEVKDFVAANSMQIAEIGLFTSSDGSGASVLSATDPLIRAFQLPVTRAKAPAAEGPANVLDANTATKFLSFGEENSGFIVTPAGGASTVGALRITTANDAAARDPMTFELYGTNDPITSAPFSNGDAENWTLIASGATNLPTDRLVAGPTIGFSNSTAYASYRLVFPTVRDAAAANSMQISGVQFFVPEPSALGLAIVAAVAGSRVRRPRKEV
jgi:alpha-L-fucosidase 2